MFCLGHFGPDPSNIYVNLRSSLHIGYSPMLSMKALDNLILCCFEFLPALPAQTVCCLPNISMWIRLNILNRLRLR